MTENKFSDKDKDKKNEVELDKDGEKDKNQQQPSSTQKEQQPKTEQHESSSRFRRLSQFLDLLNIPRHHSGSSSSSNNSQQHSPQTPHAVCSEMTTAERRSSNSSCHNNATGHDGVGLMLEQEHQQQQHSQQGSSKRSSCVSFRSEILLFDLVNGEINDLSESSQAPKDEYGFQRVYRKTSPNGILTMYLPSREIILTGNSSSLLRGLVVADPKAIQDYRIYAQLTLTFRYGREDEEVMGIRFCNEAIMSLQQIWPKKEDPKALMNPLQEALLKRLGDGALAFTLALTAQAPPSVQLVPAKRYSGAPIGTSYDVRCFIADKTDEKFHRRASVKMGVRVIYQTDVFNQGHIGADTFTALINNPVTSPLITLAKHNTQTATVTSPPVATETAESSVLTGEHAPDLQKTTFNKECSLTNSTEARQPANKPRKSERGDSFPKLRLSPKTFRFSSRFGRSKSEVDKCPSEAFYNYSKSFQEYESICPISCSAGPQGSVDKPFLLQDGRVSLRASLNKAWYIHGEDVRVTVNIRNDSRKTVRKIKVSAIQHVDVCMFNNGKFKNVVADSDNMTPLPCEQQVAPGAILNTIIVLRPQRGVTKNWIALEDTLQRSSEADETNARIAASAVRTPHFLMQAAYQSPNNCCSLAVNTSSTQTANSHTTPNPANPTNTTHDERNVFAIYVSYYVKVKLTLSSMGGDLSLKLPFMLVHIDEEQRLLHERLKLKLQEVPLTKKNCQNFKELCNKDFMISNNLDRIESVDEGNLSRQASPLHLHKHVTVLRENNEEGLCGSSSAGTERRRNFKRSETLAKDLELDEAETEQQMKAQIHNNKFQQNSSSLESDENEFLQQQKKALKKNSKKVLQEEIKDISE